MMTIGLDPTLTYHCTGHTKDVMEQAERIAIEEKITDSRLLLLIKIAALFHDTGFLYTYKNHEKKSCEILLETLDTRSFKQEELAIMEGMIMATKVPQMPHNLPEMILCDADLDYLGRDDFDEISENLRKEFLSHGIIKNDEEWDKLQVGFFDSHNYFTASSIRNRKPLKTKHLEKLKQKLVKHKS